ncbi:hypothetical protein CDIK_0002 [Cucumispora dikerogammari]|nr:hypothetical protein CDIK_0002 [Cucumispora dikerogammari]
MRVIEYKGNAIKIYSVFRILTFALNIMLISVALDSSTDKLKIFKGFVIRQGLFNMFALAYVYASIVQKNMFQMQLYIGILAFKIFQLITPLVRIIKEKRGDGLILAIVLEAALLIIEICYTISENREFHKIFEVVYFRKFGSNHLANSMFLFN